MISTKNRKGDIEIPRNRSGAMRKSKTMTLEQRIKTLLYQKVQARGVALSLKPVYEFREKDRHHDDVRFDERPSRRWHSESGPEESRQRPHSNHKSQKHSVTSFLESSFLSYNRGSIFKRTCQVGEGTYGKVYKAVNIKTNNMVALKRLRLEAERDGVPITAVREIKLLSKVSSTTTLFNYRKWWLNRTNFIWFSNTPTMI